MLSKAMSDLDCSITSIKGGGWHHFARVVREKARSGMLSDVRRIIIIGGTNDFNQRPPPGQGPIKPPGSSVHSYL